MYVGHFLSGYAPAVNGYNNPDVTSFKPVVSADPYDCAYKTMLYLTVWQCAGRLGQALDMMNHAVSGTFVPGVRENMAYFTSTERRSNVYVSHFACHDKQFCIFLGYKRLLCSEIYCIVGKFGWSYIWQNVLEIF